MQLLPGETSTVWYGLQEWSNTITTCTLQASPIPKIGDLSLSVHIMLHGGRSPPRKLWRDMTGGDRSHHWCSMGGASPMVLILTASAGTDPAFCWDLLLAAAAEGLRRRHGRPRRWQQSPAGDCWDRPLPLEALLPPAGDCGTGRCHWRRSFPPRVSAGTGRCHWRHSFPPAGECWDRPLPLEALLSPGGCRVVAVIEVQHVSQVRKGLGRARGSW